MRDITLSSWAEPRPGNAHGVASGIEGVAAEAARPDRLYAFLKAVNPFLKAVISSLKADRPITELVTNAPTKVK